MAYGDGSHSGFLTKQERTKTLSKTKMSKSDMFMALNSIGVADEEMSEIPECSNSYQQQDGPVHLPAKF